MSERKQVLSYREASAEDLIDEIVEYLDGDARLYAVEVAQAAEAILLAALPGPHDDYTPSLSATADALRAWLGNERPRLPESTIEHTLYWLRRVKP